MCRFPLDKLHNMQHNAAMATEEQDEFTQTEQSKSTHRRFVHPAGFVTVIRGRDDEDAKPYQEKQIRRKINEILSVAGSPVSLPQAGESDLPPHIPTEEEIRESAKRYPRHIRWSDEDGCFVGSLPDICGDCTHGDTIAEVAANLDEVAEMCVECDLEDGRPLPEIKSRVVVPSPYREGDTGNKVAALRSEWGYTQKNFAALLGVSLSTLTKWETGQRTPCGPAAKLLSLLAEHPELVK